MSSNNRYLIVAFNFHIMHMFISPPSLHVCLIRYPQIPMGTMAAIFGYHPPDYATVQTVVTRCFSSSIPNPWSSHQQLAIIKSGTSPQQADLFMSNPPDVPSFPPFGQRTQKECLFFRNFFITRPTDNTLFCSTVKLRKLKCTR